jgi:GT2 family glycosyltransferase
MCVNFLIDLRINIMVNFSERPEITLSVVSHGQGNLIRNLFEDISRRIDVSYEIILTLNIPEDEGFISEFPQLPIQVIRNAKAKGFGANHNAAFLMSTADHFAVVNPDIRADEVVLRPLLKVLSVGGVGACGPAIYSSCGKLEDSARRFPTIGALLKRRLVGTMGPDYVLQDCPSPVDWLGGMFIVFKKEAFAMVGGFDEKYFMYLEDTDICRRLSKLGFRVMLHPGCKLIHEAQRASRKSWRHMRWHLASAVRFFRTNYESVKEQSARFDTGFVEHK